MHYSPPDRWKKPMKQPIMQPISYIACINKLNCGYNFSLLVSFSLYKITQMSVFAWIYTIFAPLIIVGCACCYLKIGLHYKYILRNNIVILTYLVPSLADVQSALALVQSASQITKLKDLQWDPTSFVIVQCCLTEHCKMNCIIITKR